MPKVVRFRRSMGCRSPGSSVAPSTRACSALHIAYNFNLLWGFGYYKTRWLAEMSETQSLQIYRIGTPFFWRRVLGDLDKRSSMTGWARAIEQRRNMEPIGAVPVDDGLIERLREEFDELRGEDRPRGLKRR